MHIQNTLNLVLTTLILSGCGRPPENPPATKESVVQAASAAMIPSAIQWTNENVLEAIQRGTALPSYITASAVEFKTNESAHPSYAMSGSVTLRFEADTYRAVENFSYKSHHFTLVKRVRSKGDTVATEFQSRFSADSPDQAKIYVSTGDWNRQGNVIKTFDRALDVDSEIGQKAVAVREQAIAAEKKLSGISQRAGFAVTLRELITEDELVAPRNDWWGQIGLSVTALGYQTEGKAIEERGREFMPRVGANVSIIGTLTARKQAVFLVKPEILADADQLIELRDRLHAELRAAERFFSEEL